VDPKVHIWDDVVRERVNVYIEIGRNENGQRLFLTPDGRPPLMVVEGSEPPLYMWIPAYIARALGEALAPRPEASERHLDDALMIRDRLLTMIEADAIGRSKSGIAAEHIREQQ
jgi:hypothetical protein